MPYRVIVLCRIVLCRVVSCHVVSCHVVSCRIVSRRVVSCHVVSRHVVCCFCYDDPAMHVTYTSSLTCSISMLIPIRAVGATIKYIRIDEMRQAFFYWSAIVAIEQ